MSISALSYVEELAEWTANNITYTGSDGGYDVYLLEETELSYPGHFGRGVWVLTGEYRISDLTDFQNVGFFLLNDETPYGGCGGNPGDTSWHQFSLMIGWGTDLPSTMVLGCTLSTNGAADVVKLRNVRLAFVQITDAGGMKTVGRYGQNPYGYHVLMSGWWHGASANAVVPVGNTSIVYGASANSTVPSGTELIYLSHMNGFGVSSAIDANTVQVAAGHYAPYASNNGGRTMRLRSSANYQPSVGIVSKVTGHSTFVAPTLYTVVTNDVASSSNVNVQIIGGAFMMIAVKANTDVIAANTTYSQLLSVNTSVTSNLTAANTASTRYMVFGYQSSYANTPSLEVSVNFANTNLYSGETVMKGGLAGANPHNAFIFGCTTTHANQTIEVSRSFDNSSGNAYADGYDFFAIPLDRNYINSSGTLGGTANNSGSATRSWDNVAFATSANTTHFAQMNAPLQAAANNNYLRVTNFGFADHISANATIGYIYMDVTYQSDPFNYVAGTISWDDIKMVVDGSAVGASAHWAGNWVMGGWETRGPTANGYTSTYWNFDFDSVGGTESRDGLWNYRPTAAQVRSSDFGFQMRVKRNTSDPGCAANIAYVRAYIYFREPGDTVTYMVSCTASAVSVASIDGKDVTKGLSTTAPKSASIVKVVAPVPIGDDFSSTVAAITKTATKPLSGVVGNVVSIGRTFTKGLSIAANNVPVIGKAINRATLTGSAGNVVTIGKAMVQRSIFTMQAFWTGGKATTKVGWTATANSTVTATKRTTKPNTLSQGKTVSFLKAITKPKSFVQASVKTFRKNVVKPITGALSSVVTLFEAHKLFHYTLDLPVTVVTVATVRKSVAATRSTTVATVGSLIWSWNYFLNIAAATFGSTASIVKSPTKNVAIVAPSVKTVRKQASRSFVATAGAIATNVKRPAKALKTFVGSAAGTVRGVGKVFTKVAASTKTFRKNAGKPVASSFTASVKTISKAATRRLVITQGTARTVLKAITRPYSKVAASTKTFRKNVGKPMAATGGATAWLRKATTRRLTTAVVSVATIQKAASRRLASVAASLVKVFTAEKQSRTKWLRWVSTSFEGFRETANSVLRLGTSESAGSYEYITYTTHAVAAPDSTTWQVPAIEADELKPSHTDTTELKI